MTRTYTATNGRTYEYDAAPAVADFVDRIAAMIDDPKKTENDAIAAVHSIDNPIMDTATIPGRAMVTAAVFADPVYHVLSDLIFRKRIAQRKLDVAKLAEPYTMSASEFARQLGVSRSSVHQAMESHRLAAWKVDGEWKIDPRSLQTFQLKPRGPAPAGERGRASRSPLIFRTGSAGDSVLRVKAPPSATTNPTDEPGVSTGTVPLWRRVQVYTANRSRGDEGGRYFELVPGDELNEIAIGPFYVRGKFDINSKVNNPKKARGVFDTATGE